MELRVLGPLEVVHEGRPLDVGPHKQRSLLALLLIHANRVVATDRILDELWGEDAEGKENALWTYVSRLRSILEPRRAERGESSVLLTRDHGYVLSVDPDSIDVHRFETAAGEGRALIRDDPAAASGILTEALGLWRGSAFEDFAYDGFAQTEITRLEELRVTAVGDRIEADLRRGQAGELVGELEALQNQHPMQERFVSLLMLALYRSGRQADALRTFERFRRHIGEELGIEPSPELRRLEEQVLLHDSRIQARRPAARRTAGVAGSVVNPFKGLRPFHEDDSSDFFGRDRLVADVVRRLDEGERLIGLVGPSGSGKSSVVRAGLIPALRKGAITGSDRWLVAQMVPGSHPFAELEAALLRSSLDAPDSLTEQFADPDTGILRAVLRVLPSDDSRLLLVIDQLEELFTLVEDEAQRGRFLAGLLTALDDPHGRVKVVVTLRADFYDRPLAYPEFGSRLGDGVVNVVPLMPDELEWAAQGPAQRAGVSFEPAALAALLTDVVGQPGALPLFQYTLTELFDRRVGDTLTLDSYRAVDGVRGALTRRADDLYAELDPEQQAAAKQLLLRLITIADSNEWGRRRVPASEIVSLDVDVVALQGVIELYTAHRLLTLDRDHVTGSPTVEVAHEALLTEWDRLREWIEESRDDVRRHASLTTAMNEWSEANHDPGYLLTGSRLADCERWSSTSSLKLTVNERQYLDTALERREEEETASAARITEEAQLRRRARTRLWGLASAIAMLAAVGIILVVGTLGGGTAPVALVFEGRGDGGFGDTIAEGFDRGIEEFGVEAEESWIELNNTPAMERAVRQASEEGAELIVLGTGTGGSLDSILLEFPDTHYVFLDTLPVDEETGELSPLANGSYYVFAEEEGSYLVGAAAALKSETGTIGFIGGVDFPLIWKFEAGFEAGARSVRPDIVIMVDYLTPFPDFSGFGSFTLGFNAATDMYQADADVIYPAAGFSGKGVFEAADVESGRTGTHLWAIGVDTDEYESVSGLELAEGFEGSPDRWKPHILTSMVKRVDLPTYLALKDYADGTFRPGVQVLDLAAGGVDYATSGGFIEEFVDELEALRQQIIDREIEVPVIPERLK